LRDGVLYVPDPSDLPHAAGGGAGIRNGNGNGNGRDANSVQGDDEVTLRFYLTSTTSSTSVQLEQIEFGVSLFHTQKKWKSIDTFLIGWKDVNYVGQPPVKGDNSCGGLKLKSLEEKESEVEVEGWIDEKKRIQMKELWDVRFSSFSFCLFSLPFRFSSIPNRALPLSLHPYTTGTPIDPSRRRSNRHNVTPTSTPPSSLLRLFTKRFHFTYTPTHLPAYRHDDR
jgi:hypothetical protein